MLRSIVRLLFEVDQRRENLQQTRAQFLIIIVARIWRKETEFRPFLLIFQLVGGEWYK